MELVRDAHMIDLPSPDQLTAQQVRTLRLLSVHPGQQIDVFAAAVLEDTDLETARVRLDSLTESGFLKSENGDRFSIPESIRQYAASITELNNPELATARDNLITWYADLSHQADKLIYSIRLGAHFDDFVKNKAPALIPFTDNASAHEWITTEFDTVVLLQKIAAEHQMHEQVIAFASAARLAQLLPRSLWPSRLEMETTGLISARKLGNRKLEVFLLCWRSGAYRDLNELSSAIKDARAALEIADALEDPAYQLTALHQLGSYLVDQQALAEAEKCFHHILEISLVQDEKFSIALSYCNLGKISAARGDYQRALEYAQLDLSIRRELRSALAEAYALLRVATAWQGLGDYHNAIACVKEALALYQISPGSERYTVATLRVLADCQKQSGLLDEAKENLRKAEKIRIKLKFSPDEEITI